MAGESAAQVAAKQREKAERLLRRAEMYEKGAAGEAQTAHVLARLPQPTWAVMHDVRWPGRQRANIDHVVVGPPGVFVIDSKNWSGRVQLKDGILRQNGYRRENEVAGAADAAVALAGVMTGLDPCLVRGVLCITRAELSDLGGWARDVAVATTANIVDMLLTAPTVLTEAQVSSLAMRVDMTLGTAVEVGATPRPIVRADAARMQATAHLKPSVLKRLIG